MNRLLLLSICLTLFAAAPAQTLQLKGFIRNTKLEPIALATIQVKDGGAGTVSKEDGSYTLELEPGKYEVVVTMVGYKPQVLTVVLQREDVVQHFILEEAEGRSMKEVIVRTRARDRSEEYIRHVIQHKERIRSAAGSWSAQLYLRAVQTDSLTSKRKPKRADTATIANNRQYNGMSMAEVVLQLDRQGNKIKEERLAVSKRGLTDNLFFLSATESDFDPYDNLIKMPALSATPFISPFSYSGLLAYKFKLLKTEVVHGRKQYRIAVKPRQMSNTALEGEVVILDSVWVIAACNFQLPPYHLGEYDFFGIEQQYAQVQDKAWMPVRTVFTYTAKKKGGKRSGHTVVTYKNYELGKQFAKNHFGTELSATAAEAYKKDSLFWNQTRPEPLSEKELGFIRFKDSVYHATHTKTYLDSLDRSINKTNWKKILYKGQELSNHQKGTRWSLPPLTASVQVFQLGGPRLSPQVSYLKRYESRKMTSVFANVSYGFRNRDVNGSVVFNRLYNPFNRGYYQLHVRRDFEFIFAGDAWINMIRRSNIYLDQSVGFEHGLEIANGLFLSAGADMALRRSVSNYRTSKEVDSLLTDVFADNRAVAFSPYNALYGNIRLQYTPFQRYVREPKEKIILGSSWPTFYMLWRKGIRDVFNSDVDFDYLELGVRQEIKLGLMGISTYRFKTGSFPNTRDLRRVDYQWQRRGDPFLFLSPDEAFQALDSTFALFKRFYQLNYTHQFNGALLKKIPLFKKLGLREMAGGGLLIAPERTLSYAEVFTGVERVFKWSWLGDNKFKLGVYVVGSAANQFRNPVQFKVGIMSWDARRNRWF